MFTRPLSIRMLAEPELSDCVLLILANKMDLPTARPVAEIQDRLQVENFPANLKWCVQCRLCVLCAVGDECFGQGDPRGVVHVWGGAARGI